MSSNLWKNMRAPLDWLASAQFTSVWLSLHSQGYHEPVGGVKAGHYY